MTADLTPERTGTDDFEVAERERPPRDLPVVDEHVKLTW